MSTSYCKKWTRSQLIGRLISAIAPLDAGPLLQSSESVSLLVIASLVGHTAAILMVLGVIVHHTFTPSLRSTREHLRRLCLLLGVLLLSGLSLVVILNELWPERIGSVAE